jgi:hypothetical protein
MKAMTSEQMQMQGDRHWVERMTVLLDTRFRIPGTSITFGIDPILGLLPVAGDLVAAIISAFLILTYVRIGIPNALVVRMVGNLVIDLVFGSIPVLGTVFDVVFKANEKNRRLAEGYLSTWAR